MVKNVFVILLYSYSRIEKKCHTITDQVYNHETNKKYDDLVTKLFRKNIENKILNTKISTFDRRYLYRPTCYSLYSSI